MTSMTMTGVMAAVPSLMTVVGILAFVVSVIVEVIKDVGPLAKLPTDFVVILLSLFLSVATFFGYASMYCIVITWYYAVGMLIAGFFVAFVAMYGWTTFTDLYDRFKK